MIVENYEDSSIQMLGEVQTNKVGIDEKNIDFLATLLTANLYSHPFESFLREAVSNAYDSHIEAKATKPILLLVEVLDYCKGAEYWDYVKNKVKIKVTLRDYGVGLSPERFNEIYTNIGSSTKRSTNEYIGGWGIGRFAALACSNMVSLTSYYNGTMYQYQMYKNGSSINIDKVFEKTTDEGNGLELCLTTTVTEKELGVSIYKLCFFKDLMVKVVVKEGVVRNDDRFTKIETYFKNREILHYENFDWCSLIAENLDYFSEYGKCTFCKIGNVLYNVEFYDDTFSNSDGLVYKLNVGEVDVTPNREALQYTEKTKKATENVATKTIQEAQDLIVDDIKSKTCTLLSVVRDCMDNRFIRVGKLKLKIKQYLKDTSKLGIPTNVFSLFTRIWYNNIDCKTAFFSMEGVGRRRGMTQTRALFNSIIFYKKDNRTKSCLIAWAKQKAENAQKSCIIITKENLRYWCEKFDSFILVGDSHTRHTAISYILHNIEYYVLDNNNLPDGCVDTPSKKANRKKVSIPGVLSVRKYTPLGFMNTTIRFTDQAKKDWKHWLKGTVVYSHNTTQDSLIRVLAGVIPSCRACFITMKKSDIKISTFPKKFISLSSFLAKKHPIWVKAATAEYLITKIFPTYPLTPRGISSYPLKIKMENYIRTNSILTSCAEVTAIIKSYMEKGWLEWGVINEFKLSSEERRRLLLINRLYEIDLQNALFHWMEKPGKRDSQLGVKRDNKQIIKLLKVFKNEGIQKQ